MPEDDFAARLAAAVPTGDAGTAGYAEVLGRLRSAAEVITRELGAGDLLLRIEPGFQANIGQQLSMVTVIPSRNYRDVLFRAYVPVEGYPVQLDLFGEELVPCGSLKELDEQVLKFVQRPEVQARLAMLADIARSA